ncbi:DUF6528 family protein [Echinicola vietnamensis]|uniref:Uncharacterized protein n=1 Tax=Echinicola vietnamensis (strain DSM 17526 / LMG 23754 / KMM 6221) TaxID=926556 RepID=L0G5D8_ECHVK|nr:DUF6528 family protein [Echinicola vietnamensis]AGA80508.1 hypothetical protein Echvi_4320 [Echinicola vietnamensis DSM 17526]
MKTNVLILVFLAATTVAACVSRADNEHNHIRPDSSVRELIVCGDDKVLIFHPTDGGYQKEWEWSAANSNGMPPGYVGYFKTNDECKPVGDNRLLVTSSGGGAALIERSTGNTLFYAHVPNAHSAEYLPEGRIAVALSTASGGNAIQLFDALKPNKVLYSDSLYSGHGVVWVEDRESLFALGYGELREYKLKEWDSTTPKLEMKAFWEIPDESGHDLYLTKDQKLLFSTTNSVWEFNLQTNKFGPFDQLENVGHVKSINYHSGTKELVYTKGEVSWWTHHVYFANPADTLTDESVKIYKSRVYWKDQTPL